MTDLLKDSWHIFHIQPYMANKPYLSRSRFCMLTQVILCYRLQIPFGKFEKGYNTKFELIYISLTQDWNFGKPYRRVLESGRRVESKRFVNNHHTMKIICRYRKKTLLCSTPINTVEQIWKIGQHTKFGLIYVPVTQKC